VLTGAAPTIASVLRMQLVALGERKAAVEKASSGVAAALAQLQSRQTLSIDELCELIRRIDMAQPYHQRLRELINKEITP
jgi:hypothetical protein